MDYIKSELRAKDLLHVIDPNIKTNENLNEQAIEKQKFKVKDILINRIDQNSYNKLYDLTH